MPGELGAVACRTLVMVAIPGTSHGLLAEKPGLCHLLITEFLTQDPVPTHAPVRRAAPSA